MVLVSNSEDERRRAVYEQSPNDVEAARRLGLKPNSFSEWRKKRGLPAKTPPTPTLSAREEDRRRRAYEAALTDGDAARLLGLQRGAFASWRERAGLPAKARVGGPVPAAEDDRRRRAFEATRNDVEAARALGISTPGFRAWRDRRGLPPKGRPGFPRLTPTQQRRRRALYDQGLTDGEIAGQLGLTNTAIHNWRRRNDLPTNHPLALEAAERHRRLAAYHACPNDAVAGRRLGMAAGKFREWRVAERLPAKRAPWRSLLPAEHARRLDAYHRTGNDREAARLLGMPHESFSTWRIKADLVCKAARGPSLPPDEEARRHRIYWASPTDAAAARAIGLCLTSYTYWRRTRELSPRHPVQDAPAAVVEERKRVIETSRTRQEAADDLGVRPATIAKWVRRYGIPGRRGSRRPRRTRLVSPGPSNEVREAAA